MRAFTSISNPRPLLPLLLLALCLGLVSGASFPGLSAQAAEPAGNDNHDRTAVPEEDDFSGSPYTDYGEFNELADEEENAQFFRYGRFFGISIGGGFQGVTGNRGTLYQGGFPLLDLKIHYWFDFDFALQMGVSTVSHYYEAKDRGHVDVHMLRVGVDLKYYFPTRDLSSAITFGNPHLLIGAGEYTKSEASYQQDSVGSDSSFGFNVGGGLEFILKPRKVALDLEAKYHYVNFQDTYTTNFQNSNSLEDLTGGYYTFVTSLLFTW